MVTSTNEVQLNVEDKSQPTTNVTHPVLVRQIYSLQLPRMILGLLMQVHPIILETLVSYNPFVHLQQSIISTVNGSISPIIGEGSVILSKIRTLNSVLFLTSLEYNLLSVSQITSPLACTTITF